MEIYILATVNTNNYGFNTKDVEVYSSYDDAQRRMEELYREECKERGVEPVEYDDIRGNATNYLDCWYAYCHGVYWDIFHRII